MHSLRHARFAVGSLRLVRPLAFFTLAACLLTTAAAEAQTPVHLWSKSLAGTGDEQAYGVATDLSGNVYITGTFQGFIPELGNSTGGDDIFLAKYDVNGGLVWGQRFGGFSDETPHGIDVDAAGNVVITGEFSGLMSFGGPPLSSVGSSDVFVAEFTSGGTHLWSTSFGGASSDRGWSVAVDGVGNVLVCGEFLATMTISGNNVVNAGGFDAFLVKYTPGGTYQWSKALGGTATDTAKAVAMDVPGNVFVTGTFNGTVDFGGGNLVSVGPSDMFLAKYGPGGLHLWSQRYGGTAGEEALAVAVDASANVFVTGNFFGTANFGGANLVSLGARDVFLARYDNAGAHQWSQRFGGTSDDFSRGAAVDGSGSVSITGWSLSVTANFGGLNLASAGELDVFLAKYNAAGLHQWSQRFGSIDDDSGNAVATDPSGNVVMAGTYSGSVNFGGDPLVYNVGLNIFTAKYAPDTPSGVGGTPTSYVLSVSNYPNPFNPRTTVSYTVPSRGNVSIAVYDAHGARIATLFSGERATGAYSVTWDGRRDGAAVAASGVYFARIEHASGTRSKKMVLLK